MEDVRSPEKSSALRSLAVVVRQFAGSRVERQVLAQVFEVVWQVSESPTRRPGSREEDQHGLSCGAARPAAASRVTEGVAS